LNLLDEFETRDVIVVNRENGQSVFRHLEEDNLNKLRQECPHFEQWVSRLENIVS